MSYDVAVWEGERPGSDSAAIDTFDELWVRYEAGEEEPTARILAYIDEVTVRYPDLKDVHADDADDSPWASSHLREDVVGTFCYLTLAPSKVNEALPFLAEVARRHGLVCFDPQQTRLL